MVPSLLLASCISFTLVAAEIKLPDGPIIAAWQNWGACNDTQTIQAVERGVNVVFWFSSNLVKDGDKPKISGPLPDLECVARVRKAIKEKGLPTAHLLSIGGWDAPHPDTSFTGTEWFHAWNEWNQGLPMPFDGFDWDLEGNDYLTSPYNVFSPACLQLVVDMSAAAKAAGYLVTMAPPQTYFDSTTPHFNRYLNNSNPPDSQQNFQTALLCACSLRLRAIFYCLARRVVRTCTLEPPRTIGPSFGTVVETAMPTCGQLHLLEPLTWPLVPKE